MLSNVLFAIILMLPLSIMALTCDQNDAACKNDQAKLQALENAGIKPTATTNFSVAPSTTDKVTEYPQVQPFKIPVPESAQTPKDKADAATTEPQKKSFLNIFNSSSDTTSTDMNNQQRSSTPQDSSPTNQQSTGIYR